MVPNFRLSMESNCGPQLGLFELKLLKIWVNFKHINSLLGKRRMIAYFRKNISKIPGDNGSSLKKLITLKINVLPNITITKTSVLVVNPWFLYSVYYPPLLCTSCDVSKICLPSIYIPIECSPNDQTPPKLFVSINSTDIYISSCKFVLNKSISMEIWFNTFPLAWWCEFNS
jgi:hypothetical protein